jgi:putative spermidine/putrescine transport system ATP-binding protein
MSSSNPGVGVTLKNCSVRYGAQLVLQPLDLTVEPGETLVLLGPSGCGKTTTLRIIAGLAAPLPGGTVHFGAQDVTALPIDRREVGMVFQSYALFPNMSVAQNVGYGLKVRGWSQTDANQRIDEMLAMMRIGELRDRRIEQLSGGQKQRVALARAIAVRPRVLLLDEPLTALDARLRDTLRVEIHALLQSLRITTVFVTHDQAEAMALGDRIAVMNRGQIAQLGTPEQIYRTPADAFVADFIGTSNVVEGVRFRPEEAELVSPDRATWVGQVQSNLFLGDHRRLEIHMPSGEDVVLRLKPETLVSVGQTVGLRLQRGAAC